MADWLFATHCALSWAMVGLIAFVEAIHYPLLRLVPHEMFAAYASEHVRRAGWLIAPLMLGELGTGLGLALIWCPWLFGLSLVLLGLAWLSTFVVQVPLHRILIRGRDEAALSHLIASNKLRTAAWAARGGILVWLAVGGGP